MICKTPISRKIWARKLVRWFGFLVHPDYDLESIEISSCAPYCTYDPNEAITYVVTNEDDIYYYAFNDDGNPIILNKNVYTRANTVFTGKVYYKREAEKCFIVDSDNEFEERLKKSEARVRSKRG